MRTDVYERILQELADGELDELEVKIYHFLRRVYPASLTRYELLECVYGYRLAEGENLNNNGDDRKIRTAIAAMFDKGCPVVSTSAGAGYRIDIDLTVWEGMIAELEKREQTLHKRIDAAQRIVSQIQRAGRSAIPTSVPPAFQPVRKTEAPRQMSFIDGAS